MPIKWTICLLLIYGTAASPAPARSQTPPRENGQQTSKQSPKPLYATDPASVPIAISDVEKGEFGPLDIQIIARWHALQAIPLLKTRFEQSKDLNTKGEIANALVRLGENNGPYWDFLVDDATRVINDGPPTAVNFDANGKPILAEPSKSFTDWATRHRMSVQQAWNDATPEAVGAIIDLGSSDDQRAVPILREALASENDFVKIAAAQGLAALHDTDSVPEIIKVCESAPKEVAWLIAQYLVYFDDPAAGRAVDKYVPKIIAQELREDRAQGKTPYD